MKTTTEKKTKKHSYKLLKEIEYVTDHNGKKSKVILPVKIYESLLEDLHDLSIVADRKYDKTIEYDEAIRELKKDGLL